MKAETSINLGPSSVFSQLAWEGLQEVEHAGIEIPVGKRTLIQNNMAAILESQFCQLKAATSDLGRLQSEVYKLKRKVSWWENKHASVIRSLRAAQQVLGAFIETEQTEDEIWDG